VSERAFLGLGSNLGDRWMELKNAVCALPDVDRVSPVYETEPLGVLDGQPPYLNCVVELHTTLSARELRDIGQSIEERAGRIRKGKYEPRQIDVDVLLVGESSVNDTDLTVPHPRMRQRRFVLQPLSDLAPEIVGQDWETGAFGSVQKLTESVYSPAEFAGIAETMSSSNSRMRID
jgi:2-amino-4-hydroxy-6-hydroxymethyldihydropteridine diphosphokinase